MDYNFNEIEKKWQKFWEDNRTYQVKEDTAKPKFYVLDMFPYPSGAGLHVGHPLGYIASDIYSRYKRLKGFNVLHPMGYDAYGLPAEQYAIQTGQHPAITTEQNIRRYREQLDKIGFCFDWSREIRTCEPEYYKWTQWAFIQMFNSYYDLSPNPLSTREGEITSPLNPLSTREGEITSPLNPLSTREGEITSPPAPLHKRGGAARPISELIEVFERQGTKDLNIACTEERTFSAEEWKALSEKEKQETLMNYRIAYLADTMVNWCPALGTVLANDEVSEGFSIRGGHPVEQRKMKQWSLRVSAYAQRLLDGLDTIDWTESLKETQRYWIGRSEGAEIHFDLSPNPSPQERGANPTPQPLLHKRGEPTSPPNPLSTREGEVTSQNPKGCFKSTTDENNWKLLINIAKDYRSNQTEAEDTLWQAIRAKKIGYKIRRQHIVDGFIADFINLEKQVIIEIDGGIHLTVEQKERDEQRTKILNQFGFDVIRFTNADVLQNVNLVAEKIKNYLDKVPSKRTTTTPLSCGEGQGERSIKIFTTRADTIFGVTFMVLAPESEYVEILTTDEQRNEVQAYLEQTKKRTERERIADRKVTGVFSGSYAINPANGEEIPIWISDYVLAGYGTGAIMAVPGHDSRDYAFAKHFNLPIIPLIEGADISEESYDAKEGIMINSPTTPLSCGEGSEERLILNGLTVKEAIEKAKEYIAENELGKIKVNYRLRDAIFSRQRYWGEPFPIYYKDGMPHTVDEKDLPIELPEVDKFLPTETGEPPLGRAKNWEYEER